VTVFRKSSGRQEARPGKQTRDSSALLLLAPALIIFVTLVVYPLLNTVWLSLFDYGLTNPVRRFVGLGNYLELMRDGVFWLSLKNNVIILLGSVIIQVGLGLVFAAVLERGIKRSAIIFRTILFAPMVMSVVAVGLLWQLIYNPSIGILSKAVTAVGLTPPRQGWLGDPDIVVYAILGVACWQYTGFMMVLLLAGMQSVANELYDAATIDGANDVQSFWYITLPGIRNVLIVAVLITMIGAFKVFDIVYVLTLGGPANASQVLGTYLFQNAFTFNRAGYANAIAVVLLLFTLILGLLQLRFSRRQA
jgi:raffinose/stachyose/melibiose transport system permease protein